jgi:hypothetical protein
MQNQNNTMKQPPCVISGKDLNYFTDMLAWNLTAAKEAREFSTKVNDQDVKQELVAAYQMHKKHYEQLEQFLQKHNHNQTNA